MSAYDGCVTLDDSTPSQTTPSPTPSPALVASEDAPLYGSRSSFITPTTFLGGLPSCLCVGTNGQRHNLDGKVVTSDGTFLEGDYGEACTAHAEPECTGAGKPEWCDSPWCYVDEYVGSNHRFITQNG